MPESAVRNDDHCHLRPHGKPPRPHDLASLAEAARERGLTLGVREHPPLPRAFRLGEFQDYDYAMNASEVERFMSLFDNSGVALGFEVDYLEGYEDEIQEILGGLLERAAARGVPVSGVNGSVHLLPGDIDDLGVDKGDVKDVMWDLDANIFAEHIRRRGAAGMLDDYFSRMEALIATRKFEALSHIELIRKFDRFGPDGRSLFFGDVEEMYLNRAKRVIDQAAAAGIAIELNTAGMRAPLGRPYLSPALLTHCAAVGTPVSLGSDAHCPRDIGAGLDIARQMCVDAGIRSVVTFRDRRMETQIL